MTLSLKMPQLICYDWDNTILYTNLSTYTSLIELCENYNIPKNDLPTMAEINSQQFFEKWLIAFFAQYTDVNVWTEYLNLYKQFANKMYLIEGIADKLKKFHELNIPQIIISNKPPHIGEPEVIKLGLSEYFTEVYFQGGLELSKPNKHVFTFVLDDYNKKHPDAQINSTDNIWFFGDSQVDCEFAKNIDATLFLIQTEGYNTNHRTSYDKTFLLQTYSELDKILPF